MSRRLLMERVGDGLGPAGMRCEDCEWITPIAAGPRPSEMARNHVPLTLFLCGRSVSQAAWSLDYPACSLFEKAS